jgi:Na+-translocating ferredoxin:NAD+ oxidoreductase RnfE subunit
VAIVKLLTESLVDAQEEFFQLSGLETLIGVSQTANLPFSLYLSDIFVLLCGSGMLICSSNIRQLLMG